MDKRLFLAIALLIVLIMGASFAMGVKVWISGGDLSSKPYNYTIDTTTKAGVTNTRVRVLGFKIWTDTANEKLLSVNLTVFNIHNFATTDLATLSTDYTSGISIAYDTGTDGVPDTVVPLAGVPVWDTVGTANYAGFSVSTNINALPTSEPSNYNYFVQFNLSANPTNGSYFNFTLETTNRPITTTNNATAGAILNATIGSANLTIDGVPPTISLAQTKDANRNGYLDSLIITLSENINDNTLANNCFRINGSDAGVTVSTGETGNDSIIFVNWTSSEIQYTNITPIYNYTNNGSCVITDFAGNNMSSNRDLKTVDGAVPVFWGCTAHDNDVDGKLNNINCTMSEGLTAGAVKNSLFSAYVNYGAAAENSALTLSSVAAYANGNLTIILNDAVIGTGNVSLSYTSAGDGINDTKNNITLTNATNTVTDLAGPAWVAMSTVDTNKNGYIDAVYTTFSENLNEVEKTMNQSTPACFIVEALQGGSDGVSGNETGTVNDNYLYLNFSQQQYTNTTPRLNYTTNATCRLADSSGNAVPSLANLTSTDGAPPVFLECRVYDNNADGMLNNINCTLSENLTAGIVKNSLFTANVTYGKTDVNRSLTLSSVTTRSTGVEQNNITITLNDAVIGTGAVTLKYTSAADGINDTRNNISLSNTSIDVDDGVKPVVIAKLTLDNNKNGYIDAFQLNFSEGIGNYTYETNKNVFNSSVNISIGFLGTTNGTGITNGAGTLVCGGSEPKCIFPSEIIYDPDNDYGGVNDSVVFLNITTSKYNFTTGDVANVSIDINATTRIEDLLGNTLASNKTSENATDTAAPVFWVQGYSVDVDKNGAIDHINLSLSEALSANSPTSAGFSALIAYDLDGSGNTMKRTLSISSATAIAAGNVTLQLSDAVYGTGNVSLTYTAGQATQIQDAAGNVVATNGSISVADNASAVVFAEQTQDTNANGYLDAIQVNFSEPVRDNTFTDDSDNITVGSITRPSLTFNTGTTANDGVIFLYFNGTTTYNTGNTPSVNFSIGDGKNLTSNMTDIAGVNITLNATDELSTDVAAPVIWSKQTLGINRTGYLDTINITFSENVVDNTSANFTIEAISSFIFDTAFPGRLNNSIYLGFTGTTYFTNGTPMVNYSHGSATSHDNLADAVGNKVARNDTPSTGTTTTDKAPPVILSAVASDGETDLNNVDSDDYILITFSEQVNFTKNRVISNTTVNSTKEADAILYTNATGAAWAGGLDVNIGRFNNSQNLSLNITFPNANSNLSAPNIYLFFMNRSVIDMSANAVIQDNKTNVSLTGSFQDLTAPIVSSWWTNDSNDNGYIDSIVVTTDEAVNNDTCRCGVGWNVSGYSVNTLFSTCDNSTKVNLTITELTVFDTNATPAVYYNSSVGCVRDVTNNNKLGDTNTTAATDKARPVLLNATTFDGDGDGYIDAYNLTFSENVTDSSFNRTGETAPAFSGANHQFTNNTGTKRNDAYLDIRFIDNNASYSTNATPDLTNSFVNDTATVQNAMLDLTTAALVEYDNAAPVFWTAISAEFTANGALDSINLTTSEIVTAGINVKGTWSATVNYGPGTRALTISSITAQGTNNLTLKLNNAVFGTGAVTLSYTSAAGGINDSLGNLLATNGSISVTDNASAVVFAEQTQDTNTNGYLDAILVNFSEPVRDNTFTDDSDNITVGSITRPSLTFNTGTTANDDEIYLYFNGTTTYNSGNTPSVNFSIGDGKNLTSNMTDIAGVNITLNATDELSTDKAVPLFWFGDSYDIDNNGALDYINLTMSESMASTAQTSGFLLNATYDKGYNRSLTVSSSRTKGAKVEFILNNAVFGTGAIIASYAQDQFLNDSSNNLVASNSSVASADNVSAVFLAAWTIDSNSNGYLDAVQVNFSEPIGNYTFGTNTSAFNGTNNISVGTILASSLTFDTYNNFLGVNDSVIYLNFTGTTYNTGDTQTVNFSSNATSRITDMAGVQITYVTNTQQNTSTDKAVPVIWSKQTLGFNRTGYLDTINITFSENVVDNTSANFTIEGITSFIFNTAFPGRLNNSIYLGFTGTTYFTNGTPMVNYSHGSATSHDNLADAVGNKVARNDTPAAGVTTTDKAPPVILSAVADDGAASANGPDSDDYIFFTFSEAVNLTLGQASTANTAVFNDTVHAGDAPQGAGKFGIFYTNGSTYHWDIAPSNFNAQNTTLNMTFNNTNSNITAPNFLLIFMNASFKDSANNAVPADNKTNVSLTGSFQDVVAPTVSSWWTNDSNSNGYIDSIVVTLNEAVNNDTCRCGVGWNVTGYSVNTILSTCNNVSSVNLTITELAVFDTNATMAVYYNRSLGCVRDVSNNNVLVDTNTTAATDKARPVLLNATTFDEDGDGYIDAYNLTFSENVSDYSFGHTGEVTNLSLDDSLTWAITEHTGNRANDTFYNLKFVDNRNTSNATPSFVGSILNDTVNNPMAIVTYADLTEYDNAAPVFWMYSEYGGNFTNRSGKDGWWLDTEFKVNQNITIKFNVSENVTQPTVTVGGNAATLVGTTNTTQGVMFEYYYVVAGSLQGGTTLSISATDLAGRSAVSNTRTNTSQNLTIDSNMSRPSGVAIVDWSQDDGRNLKLTWTAVSDADFYKYTYHCNLTNTSTLPHLTAVSTSFTRADNSFRVAAYNDGTNTTLQDGTEYYCVINVTDDVGNVNTSMNVSSIPYANGNVSLTANKWQMIGTPKYLNNTKFNANGFSTSDSLQYYNATDSTWYSLGISTDRMYQLRGYWLYNYDGLQVNTTYRASTGGVTPESITLSTGWNLISSPTNTVGTNVTTKLNNVLGSTKWSIIYYYNVTDTTWYYNTPTGEGDLGVFPRTGGFWISVTSAGNSTAYSGEI